MRNEHVPYDTHFHFSTDKGRFVALVNESNALLGCCALSGKPLGSGAVVYRVYIYCTSAGMVPIAAYVYAEEYHAHPPELIAQELLDKWDALRLKVEALNDEAVVFGQMLQLTDY